MNYIKNLYSGRISRRNFILGHAFFMLPALIFYSLMIVSIFLDERKAELFAALYFVAILLACLYVYALIVRRFHDIGKNGWSVFLFIIPIVNMVYFLILLFKKSQPIANKYGEVPDKNRKFLDDILNRDKR